MKEQDELTHGTDFGFSRLPLDRESYVWELASRGWNRAQKLVEEMRTKLTQKAGIHLASRPFPTPPQGKKPKVSRRRAS
jgi:hypothetical protein